jgi:hypothetical protein
VSFASIVTFLLLLTSTGFCGSTTIDVITDETVTDSVELTPAYIIGDVMIGVQSISRIDLDAESGDYYAKTSQTADGPYSLTVNVPKGGSLEYAVSGMAWMDNWATRMYFKERTVLVEEGQTAQVDFIIDPGYIAVEIDSNCSLTRSDFEAFLDSGEAFTHVEIRKGSEKFFRIPVQPNNNIDVSGKVQLSTGKTVTLQSRAVDVYPGTDTQVTWQVNCVPGTLGAIQHDVNYHMPMDFHYVYLYEQGTWTYSRYARHDGSHVFDELAPGTWRLYSYSYWNNGKNFIAKDLWDINVPSGEIVYAPIDEYPGFLQGKITLTGTKSIQDTSSAYVYAYGRNSLYPSYRSYARSLIESDGSYNLALPHGEWNYYITYYRFYDTTPGDNFLNTYLYMYDYSKYSETIFINEKQTITGYDIQYDTGSATIKYSRADGGDFNSPYLYAKCYNQDENNRRTSYIYAVAYGDTESDTVTFVGIPGTYEVDAWAQVDGSMTTFGKVTVVIVGGVDKEVDLGGPELTVTTPEPDSVLSEDLVTVSGIATDDISVDWITVSGVEAVLMSTDNPDDPNEVSFSVELELAEGENAIETIATDTSGNQSKDTRTVIYEIPELVSISGGIDIKPGSCKNPFNVKSKGVLPVAILGSDSFDVLDIDLNSILLEGVAPLRSSIEDAAGSSCETEGPDGYSDLSLKFDTQDMVNALGEVSDGDVITLTLSGFLLDGTEFSGEDIVTVLVKGKASPIGNSSLADLVIDFGPGLGLWAYFNDSTWTKLHNMSPETIIAEDINGNDIEDMIIDLGSETGVYIRYDDGTWSKLHNSSAENIATGDVDGNGQGEVILDFGALGIWIRYDDELWAKLHNSSAENIATGDMDGNGQDEVILDFGALGIWAWYNDELWAKLHNSSAENIATGDMDGNGQDEVIVDFGASGIWAQYNDTMWRKLHNSSAENIATGDMDGNGQDEVIMDFGASGIWVQYNNSMWKKLHKSGAENIATGDID